jgi:hypothetical protein
MPLTSKGTPLIGGYKHHPATIWAERILENSDLKISSVTAISTTVTCDTSTKPVAEIVPLDISTLFVGFCLESCLI